MGTEFLQPINDPRNKVQSLRDLLTNKDGKFVFCLGSTESSEIEGISAAGATAAARRLTPSIDADVLKAGRPRAGESIPVSPIGVVSPVVITSACLKLLEATPLIVDCGTFRPPANSDFTAGTFVARSVASADAMPYEHVLALFDAGRQFANLQLADEPAFLAISECVPGGTTTALAVLKASGLNSDHLVSSSLPSANQIRQEAVESGFADLSSCSWTSFADPFHILASFGDPMQPFVAGLVLSASNKIPVILGGGSQMLAVLHLCSRLGALQEAPFNSDNVFVVSTKWIAGDAYSNTKKLSELIGAQFFCFPSRLSCFSSSRAASLRGRAR